MEGHLKLSLQSLNVMLVSLAFPEGRLSGNGVTVLQFPECLLNGLLAAAPGPLAAVLGPLSRPPFRKFQGNQHHIKGL